jgi:aquaporin TIP
MSSVPPQEFRMDKHLRPCIAEMLGTFLLCFIGAGVICTDALMRNGNPNNPAGPGLIGIALANGIALAIAVSATMNISGGHINPAVTICMWVLGKIDTPQMVAYVVSQMLGALIAGFFIIVIFNNSVAANPDIGYGTPHVGIGKFTSTSANIYWMAALIELILTFILIFAYYGTTIDLRAPKIGGFGAGLALHCCILLGGPLTGAAMNPARYFGIGLWEAGASGDFGRLKDFYVYIIGPVLGAILAGWLYSTYVMPPEKKEIA